MQCFERKALHLQLYEYALSDIPRLEFDPNLLDDVLFEFSIDRFSALITLDERERRDIIKFIKSVSGPNVPFDDRICVSPVSRRVTIESGVRQG
ncbi:MAG: hypothetical protein ACU843_13895 [Gammaproteobacteria bacterium]